MSKAVWSGFLAAMLIAAVSGVHAQQQVKRGPINPIRDVSGAASYKEYCVQCHGTTGIGDGPVAKALKVAPADLTRIAQKHDGKFPAAAVKQIIVGDVEAGPHGGRDMPLWGSAFRSMENSSVVELRVTNLAKYIERMQQK